MYVGLILPLGHQGPTAAKGFSEVSDWVPWSFQSSLKILSLTPYLSWDSSLYPS